VLKPVPPPPSLKNIYKNLVNNNEIDFKVPKHGDLTKWANQGVFLLNASLTVEDSQPNSHAKCGWQRFTDHVIQVINEQCKEVVFLLWGKPAQEKAKSVNSNKHLILKTTHPSPLSASQGFLTSSTYFLMQSVFPSAIAT
jgi:uracil-DNA glycosylase